MLRSFNNNGYNNLVIYCYLMHYLLGISLFFQPRNHFLANVNELMQSLKGALKSFKKCSSGEKKILNMKGLCFA